MTELEPAEAALARVLELIRALDADLAATAPAQYSIGLMRGRLKAVLAATPTEQERSMITCAVCGKELNPGDLLCEHTPLEVARSRRDGCACGGDHVESVKLELLEAPEVEVTRVVELRAGDRVVFVTPRLVSMQEVDRLRRQLQSRVPGLRFAIATGFEEVVIQRAGEYDRPLKPRVDEGEAAE